jgi:hypothetical protein
MGTSIALVLCHALHTRWQAADAGLQAFRWITLLDDHFFLSVFSSCVMDLIMFGPMYVCRFTTSPSQTRKPQYDNTAVSMTTQSGIISSNGVVRALMQSQALFEALSA